MRQGSSLQQWINDEFQDIDLGDGRLDKRFKMVCTGLARKSESNIASSWG